MDPKVGLGRGVRGRVDVLPPLPLFLEGIDLLLRWNRRCGVRAELWNEATRIRWREC